MTHISSIFGNQTQRKAIVTMENELHTVQRCCIILFVYNDADNRDEI